MNKKKYKYKIIKQEFFNELPLYFLKTRNPLFGNWMYLGKYTNRFYFTRLNYNTEFESIEEIYRRIARKERDEKRCKDVMRFQSKTLILKHLKQEEL